MVTLSTRTIILIATLCLVKVGNTNALDLQIPDRYVANYYNVDLSGGLAYLPSGDLVGFTSVTSSNGNENSFDLLHVKFSKKFNQKNDNQDRPSATRDSLKQPEPIVRVLKTFSGNLAPAFVRSSADGSSVILGTFGENGKILSLDADTFELSEIVTQDGLRDLDVTDDDGAYILFQSASASLHVGYLKLQKNNEIAPIITLPADSYQKITLVADGSLYLLTNVNTKNAEPLEIEQGSLALRFDASMLSRARDAGNTLKEADGQYRLNLPQTRELQGRSRFFFSEAVGPISVEAPSTLSDSNQSDGGHPGLGGTADIASFPDSCADDPDCSYPDSITDIAVCDKENQSGCLEEVSPEPFPEPWTWDELYLLSNKEVRHFPDLSGQSQPVSYLRLKDESSLSFSHAVVAWFANSWLWCNLRQTFAVTATDSNSGKNYLIELSPVSTPENDLSCLSYEDALADAHPQEAAGNSSGPIYSLWNSFLGMVNVLELTNFDENETLATISIFDLNGQLLTSTQAIIPPSSQQDLVLNNLSDFPQNHYGVVKVVTTHRVDGRIVFYKTENDFANFDFAFVVPLRYPTFGQTVAGFNTFNPSPNSENTKLVVANWLSVANLAEHAAKFQIVRHNAAGQEIGSELIEVPASGRVDIEGGHLNPGPQQVGVIRILPVEERVPYLAQLVRYGLNEFLSFDFVLPILAERGSSMSLLTGITAEQGAQNWLEIVNTGSDSSKVAVTCYNASGQILSKQKLSVPGLGQVHLDASATLDSNGFGNCHVDSPIGSPLLVESMAYLTAPLSGKINTAFATEGRSAVATSLGGSYNLFLDLKSKLRLSNPSDRDVSARVTVFGARDSQNWQTRLGGTALGEETLILPAKSSLSLDLNQDNGFLTRANTYGALEVNSSEPLFAQLLRSRQGIQGTTDLVIATEVR